LDEDATALVRHTHRLLEPIAQQHGEWLAPGDVPETLIAILAEAGRLYLPWVAAATARGEAEVAFPSGPRTTIRATDFLCDARAVLLARYKALRSAALDAVLDRAGILRFFTDHVSQAGTVPTWNAPPQPRLNRPYPPETALGTHRGARNAETKIPFVSRFLRVSAPPRWIFSGQVSRIRAMRPERRRRSR
jgi:hypothetical protein